MGRTSYKRTLLAVALVVMGCVGSPRALASGPLSWSAPALADWSPPFVSTSGLRDVSCPSTSLCVAVGDGGEVVTSTTPTDPYSWSQTTIADSTTVLYSVSCPSTSLCVAVTADSRVFTSTNPGAADGATWTPTTVDPGNGLVHVSCASTSLCVAVDNAGNAVTSTSPQTGTWKTPALVDTKTKQLHGVSCAPGSTMCVAADDLGNVISAANATGGVTNDWTLANANTTHPLRAISCPSTTLCVTGDFWGNIITATGPTAGTSTAWHVVNFAGFSEPISVSCKSSSTTVCVMGDFAYQTGGGQVLTSTNPTGSASAWAANYVDHDPAFSNIAGMSCPSTLLCVGVDGNGDVLTTTNPTAKPSTWTQFNVVGHNSFRSISCPSTALCVAGDNAGNVYTFPTTDPTNSIDWPLETSATNYDGSSGTPMTSVACPSTSLCVAGDLVGNIVASTDPASTDQTSVPWYYVDCTSSDCASGNPIQAISCSSANLCVAIDGQGNVVTSKTPATSNTSQPGSWETTATVPATPSGISCAPSTTTTLCVIVDGPSEIYSTNPTGGPTAWHSKSIDSGNSLEAISCPSTSLCIAVDNAGNVLTATSPMTAAWSLPVHLEYGSLTTVSCRLATFTMCVALDQYTGDAFTSSNPTGGAQSWPMSVLPGNFSSALDDAAVSCATTSVCVASDDLGNVVVGRLPAPTVGSLSPASGPTGSSITINGTNFVPGARVKVGALASPTVTFVSSSQIKATVPNGATAGKVSVTTAAGTGTSASSFTPTLSVTSFSPTSGPYGTTVTINGVGFTLGSTGSTVKFNGVAASSVTRVSSTKLTAVFPSTATTGKISVTNTTGTVGTVSSAGSYTVTPHVAPTISGFSPASGATGSPVTISGSYFSGASSVKFGSLAASFSIVSASQIKATVPNGATTGTISVTTAAGTGTSASSFTPTLSVTGFSPTSGAVGTSVTINGVGFNSGSTVKFNGVAASAFTYVSSTQVKATVPSTATTGPITVTNTTGAIGTVRSAANYTVT